MYVDSSQWTLNKCIGLFVKNVIKQMYWTLKITNTIHVSFQRKIRNDNRGCVRERERAEANIRQKIKAKTEIGKNIHETNVNMNFKSI